MYFKKTIKTLTLAAIMFIGAQTSQAQDLLARQAPVDRKMKAVDTLALRNLIDREQAQMPGIDLYEDWNNKYAHKATELPDSFRINMRHFCMPTPSRVVTSNYGSRWGRQHKGIDVKVYIGDTIRAAFSGKVRIVKYEPAGYGNYVVIRHNNGLETIYGHLSKHLCKENQTVKAGDVIGLGGNTGRSTGSHLHFETRICGVALDPALLFDFVHQDVTCDNYLFRRADYEKKNRATARAQKTQKPVTPKVEAEEDKENAVASIDNNRPSRKSKKAEKAEKVEKANVKAEKETKQPEKLDKKVDKKADKKVDDKKVDKKVDNKVEKKLDKKSDKKTDKKVQSKEKNHTVAQGESLYSIAKKNGVSVDDLCKKNGIKKTDHIKPGQTLKV